MLSDLDALGTLPGVRVDASTPATELPRLPPESDADMCPPKVATRVLSGDWWVYSFSSLSKQAGPGEDATS